MSITVHLKSYRLKKNINQTEFAKLCGVSRQTIHATETSKYTPSVELALKMAKTLQANVEELFELQDE